MSDVQRPGWWRASDGKWYPPETHPDYRPPSASRAREPIRGNPDPAPQRDPAIAQRQRPARSVQSPTPSRRAWHTWQLGVVGAVCLVIGIGIGAAGSHSSGTKIRTEGSATTTASGSRTTSESGSTARTATTATAKGQSAEAAIGQTLVTSPDSEKLTVHTFEASVTPANAFQKPKAGYVFAAIEVTHCAGPAGNKRGANWFDWELQMADNTRATATIGVRQPELSSSALAANDCTRGWVSYEIPASAMPTFVVYTSAGAVGKWRIT